MLHHTTDLYAQMLSICTARMLKAHGLAYLHIMMQHINEYLDCIVLLCILDPTNNNYSETDEFCLKEPEYMRVSYGSPSLPIQTTDVKTLYETHKRFAILRELELLYRENHDDARLSDVLGEIDKLNEFLEETYSPNGIKTFVDEQRAKAANTIKREIKYFLGNIKKRDKTLYSQIKAHIHIGLKCIWMDD
jgi:hypothetical protein